MRGHFLFEIIKYKLNAKFGTFEKVYFAVSLISDFTFMADR